MADINDVDVLITKIKENIQSIDVKVEHCIGNHIIFIDCSVVADKRETILWSDIHGFGIFADDAGYGEYPERYVSLEDALEYFKLKFKTL